MRAVLQRASRASVTVDGEVVASFSRQGLVALVGVTHSDGAAEAELIARKIADLRILSDEQSVLDVGAPVIVVSQFTLYADARKGRRPSFLDAAQPEIAAPLVEHYAERLRAEGIMRVEKGVFGAMMMVEIHNDGPVTIILDSNDFK